MKLKKKVKVILIVLTIIIILGVVGVIAIPMLSKNPKKEETVKVINEVEKYGYQLKETKTKRYKTMFDELKKILQSETLDEEKYVSKMTCLYMTFIV